MKVLLIDVNCRNSSTGKIVYDLYSYINTTGNEAAICYGRGKRIKEKNIYKFGINIETLIHALLTRITGYTGCFSYFSTKRLIKYIKTYKPNVIHIHELHAYFVNIKMLMDYIKESNIKTVMTLHSEFAYTGKCGHSLECEKWRTGCEKCEHLENYVKTYFFDRTNRMWKTKKESFCNIKNLTIVVPSLWLKQRVEKSFLGTNELKIIENGVDTTIFRYKDYSYYKEKFSIDKSSKIVLFVCNDIENSIKGFRWVEKIARKFEKDKILFLVTDKKRRKESSQNIKYIGNIKNQKELAKLYSISDCLLLCSYRETYSMVCAESLCCGTPIVGFKCGAPETVFNNKYSIFVDYGNLEQMKKAIIFQINMVNNNDKTIISNAMCKKYSKEKTLSKYLNIYNL